MNVSPLVWLVTVGVIVAIIALDLLLADRRPHRIAPKEAGLWIGAYVALAIAFGVGVGLVSGWHFGGQFFAGYLTELSLSVDNLFVFVVILATFAVPETLQHRVLLLGIVIALVLRAILIVLGAAVLEAFSPAFYVFGVFLLLTALQLFRKRNEEPDAPGENAVMRRVERIVPSTQGYDGTKLFVKQAGKRLATPLFLVMIAIGTTDVLFALDSIPAIFGLTQEAYIVLTANAFALFGLRQMYFLLNGLLDRLVYLSVGLAVILGFIGVKLILHALHESTGSTPEIPLLASLGFIVVTLVVTTIASLWKVRRDPSAVHPTA